MNFNNAQKDILNHLLNGDTVRKFEIDENYVFITPNGFYGFVFPKVLLQVNIDRMPTLKAIDLTAAVNEENECVLTDECKVLYRPYKGYARKLKRQEKEIFVNEKYLKWFQNPKFYCTENNPYLVVVTESTSKSENAIVGLICSLRT